MNIDKSEDEDGVLYSILDFYADYDTEKFIEWVNGLADEQVTILFEDQRLEFDTHVERQQWVHGFTAGLKICRETHCPDSAPW